MTSKKKLKRQVDHQKAVIKVLKRQLDALLDEEQKLLSSAIELHEAAILSDFINDDEDEPTTGVGMDLGGREARAALMDTELAAIDEATEVFIAATSGSLDDLANAGRIMEQWATDEITTHAILDTEPIVPEWDSGS